MAALDCITKLCINMATAHRAPKQWSLTRKETINSFKVWKNNLIYVLSQDENFLPFLSEDATWEKKSSTNPLRGFDDDGAGVPVAKRLTAVTKNARLEMMLGQITNYCTVIAGSIILKATSLKFVWQKIREHYGFQLSGAHFLDLANITLQADESPEDLFQRLTAFYEDNILTTNCGISHHGDPVAGDEEITPTLENVITLQWLQLINPALPALVKQKYGAELRNRTISSIKPEISQAMSSLLDEIRVIEDTRVMRAAAYGGYRYSPRAPSQDTHTIRSTKPTRSVMSCTLCKASGRSHSTHFLSTCKYLPDADRRALASPRARCIRDDTECVDELSDNESYHPDSDRENK